MRRSACEVEHVVDQPAHPRRAPLAIGEPVYCDRSRIGQLLANLLGNALTHGDPAGPIVVGARTTGLIFELFVDNVGEPIAERLIPHLFRPFTRASDRPSRSGLGLGLYIASEIARAHEGTLNVVSSTQHTRFTLRILINDTAPSLTPDAATVPDRSATRGGPAGSTPPA